MTDSRRSSSHSRPVWVERLTHQPSSRTSRPVVHEHAALVFVTDGRAVHEQRGRFEVEAGDVLLVPAGEAHRGLRTTSTKAWGIGFCAPCYAPSELAILLDPFERARSGASPVVRLPTERHEHVDRLIAELYAETRAERTHGELVQKSLLALVLAEVTRAASAAPFTSSQPSLVAEALRFIERTCLEPISLSDVARAVGKSPSYVTTVLKQATGKSVVEWIIAGRLSEACNRLLHTDEMVEIIAERVGYADATHFIRLFRRVYGVTPAAWRDARRRL
jgi:AraC-like DNA-binding protein/mannose-6-phosphate isomerase-like protein (cupin superfamily)